MKEYFTFDNLSNFVALFVVFFSVIVTLYSFGFMKGKKGLLRYYLYILLTLIASLGVVFANHLVVLIIFSMKLCGEFESDQTTSEDV